MADRDDGSQPLAPSRLRSPLLRKHGRAVAAACYARIYTTWPELDRHYGERGRRHSAEDNFWHLEHLDAAVADGEPQHFADYTDWLVGLLFARGLGRHHVAGAYEFLADALGALECPRRLERHRRELIDVLLKNRARLLETAGALDGST